MQLPINEKSRAYSRAFGQALFILRQRANLTQEAVGDALARHKEGINGWEKGRSNVSLNPYELTILAKLFRVRIEEFSLLAADIHKEGMTEGYA